MATNNNLHTLVVRVENKPGVLARISGLFARRGFNINSLAVAPAIDEKFSRITIVVDVESAPLDQIVKQLYKLINVVDIRSLAPTEAVERELMVVTVQTEDFAGVRALVEQYDATWLIDSHGKAMLSISNYPDTIEEFEDKLTPFNIIEVQRTGKIALIALDDYPQI